MEWEKGPAPIESYQESFARIESAVDSGETDLSELGFWGLLRKVKAEPRLSVHWADQAGRIDRKAFEARVKVRFPVWFGNLVLLIGALAGAGGVVAALQTSSRDLAALGLVFAGSVWSISFHCPAHWAVGRLVGIRFVAYFFGGPPPPRPGLKTDYASYLRAAPGQRALMHASGALATKVAPFVALAFWPATNASPWAAAALGLLGIGQIVTDVVFSTKTSDWKKVKRERRLARAQLFHGR